MDIQKESHRDFSTNLKSDLRQELQAISSTQTENLKKITGHSKQELQTLRADCQKFQSQMIDSLDIVT